MGPISTYSWAVIFPFLLSFQELFDFIPLLFLQILVWKFYFIFNHYKLLPVWLSGLSLFLVRKQMWLQELCGPLWTNVTVIITALLSLISIHQDHCLTELWAVELSAHLFIRVGYWGLVCHMLQQHLVHSRHEYSARNAGDMYWWWS